MDHRKSRSLKTCLASWGLILKTLSPTSLKVIHRALNDGQNKTLKQVLDTDFTIASQCIKSHDTIEGIRAVVVDKDKNPRWNPPTLSEVTDAMIDKYFTH